VCSAPLQCTLETRKVVFSLNDKGHWIDFFVPQIAPKATVPKSSHTGRP